MFFISGFVIKHLSDGSEPTQRLLLLLLRMKQELRPSWRSWEDVRVLCMREDDNRSY